MEVHDHHAIDADGCQHVGNHLRGDRHARRARSPILARITEIGNCGRHPRGRCALQRIDHHEQFHQVVVRRRARRLQDERIETAHVLEQLDHHLAVRKATHDDASETDVQMAADGFRKLRVRVAREDAHAFESHLRDPGSTQRQRCARVAPPTSNGQAAMPTVCPSR
jgi:hypothetical protein